jgi:hypothetical protein
MIQFHHKQVVFGINSSPFLLAAVLQFHLNQVEEDHKETAGKLMTSIHVDNCVCSFANYREYTELRSTAVDLLAQAKMELRQWECSAGEDSGIGLQGDSGCGLESGSGVLQDMEESDSTTSVLGLLSLHVPHTDVSTLS